MVNQGGSGGFDAHIFSPPGMLVISHAARVNLPFPAQSCLFTPGGRHLDVPPLTPQVAGHSV